VVKNRGGCVVWGGRKDEVDRTDAMKYDEIAAETDLHFSKYPVIQDGQDVLPKLVIVSAGPVRGGYVRKQRR
jgi:hypothetical protein